jgi:5-oxoprolinase (ATP-hydrolysing) subunit A
MSVTFNDGGSDSMTTINCDMGESYSIYRAGDDQALMPLIELANVACGFHASDFNHMRSTVRLAAKHGVRIGAHPSLPDRQGFGRREMTMSRQELANCIIYQVGALQGFLKAEGLELNHIKPHGALYAMASKFPDVAEAVCDAADVFGVPLLGVIGTLHETVYPARGHKLVSEFYADLNYAEDGSIIVTHVHDACDAKEAADRCLTAITTGIAKTIVGSDWRVRADSICVHSDTPNAVEIASTVREAIASHQKALV